MTVGLAVFGFTTYGLYSRSEYDRLDEQLRASVPLVMAQLRLTSGLGGGSGTFPGGGRTGAPPLVVPPGTYAELRDANGKVVTRIQLTIDTSQPRLPDALPAADTSRPFSTSSTAGADTWRVLVVSETRTELTGYLAVIAVPETEVTDALHRLVLIEAAAAAGLLAVLAGGSWLILRRGLHPLEQMATTARSISAGALDQRVSPDDGRTEVGQLGLAINTMLSDLEVAFAERDATEQRLRQFLADASHELRTPLTSIRGFAELFRLGAADDPDATDATDANAARDHVDLGIIMRRIEDESTRMKVLVDDLLLLARLDQPREAQRAPVDLAVIAADACSDAVAAAPDREVTLIAPEPVVVLADAGHVRQAVANLIANAVRHTPDGTPIEVAADLGAGVATISVRDHGPGLDDEALHHAFDRFWQADHARVGPGAGLGLSIVAAIAEAHGGNATGANAAGGGAVFTITLPLNQP
jgi:two-component system OmpR family sensor kinase